MLDEHNIIHCYSPDAHHDPQAVIVNEKARQSLIKALQEGKEKTVMDAMTTDGEGFYFTLIIMNAEKIDKEYIMPYKERYARGHEVGKKVPQFDAYEIRGDIKQNTPLTDEECQYDD